MNKVAFEGTALQVLNSSDFVPPMFRNTPCGPLKLSVKGLGFIQGLPCLGLLWVPLVRAYNILPKKELHGRVWVEGYLFWCFRMS